VSNKTLGQILYEAVPLDMNLSDVEKPWYLLSKNKVERYEKLAQAVAKAERERCAADALMDAIELRELIDEVPK
jgi:hypothetical protein